MKGSYFDGVSLGDEVVFEYIDENGETKKDYGKIIKRYDNSHSATHPVDAIIYRETHPKGMICSFTANGNYYGGIGQQLFYKIPRKKE